MIKIVLLTGFLGSGKTTFLQNILKAFEEEKTGVIVNEFGEVNVDSVLVKRDGIKMAELSNGSIFCACIKDKFVDSLIEMSKTDIEYLFIEASGLADPANMVQILDGIKHKTGDNYCYLGSVCITDGETFLELQELLPALHSQIEYCSAAIVNKGDLIDEARQKSTIKKIKEINASAKTYITSFCQTDAREIVSAIEQKCGELPASRDSSNTVASRLASFVVRATEPISVKTLEGFLQDVAEHAYRIKGFALTDQGVTEVNAVGKNVELRPWKSKGEKTEIVIISSVGFKMMSIITRAIEKNGKGVLSI